MRYSTFRNYKLIIVVIEAFLVGWAVYAGNPWVPVPTVLGTIIVLYLLRRRVNEVVVDERVFRVADRAANLAYRTFGVAGAILGCTFLALSRFSADAAWAETAGFTLLFAVAGLVFIFFVSYNYYNSKYAAQRE
jgi:uncharacterized membrane protein